MKTKKGGGQEGQRDSSKELEAIEPDIVSEIPESKAASVFEEFMQYYQPLLEQALVSMLMQDSQNLRLTINQVQSLNAEAQKFADDETERTAMQAMTEMVELYLPLQRGMGFMNEGRFETAAREFKQLREVNFSKAERLNSLFDSGYLVKNKVLESIVQLHRLLGGMSEGLERQTLAELVGYQGRTQEYVDMLKDTVKAYREAAAVAPPGSSPEIVKLSHSCTNIADQLEARAEVFARMEGEGRVEEKYIQPTGQKVFIIHGHDEASWRELRDLLEDEFNLAVVVLKEEVGISRTIIQKFEDHAMDSCLAFAILTPDDFIEKREADYWQARPNVLFEMGWFYGRFGPGRLIILKKKGTEIPSDLDGISTIEYHDNVTEKSLAIRKELRQIGVLPKT